MKRTIDPGWLADAITAACAAWPGVDVAAEDFSRWIEERLDSGADIGDLHTNDLYLACACAAGDARAVALFEERVLGTLDRALGRLGLASYVIDETKQRLRTTCLVGEAGCRPTIASYSGRGELRSWARASAIRVALRVVRPPAGQVDVDSSVMRAFAAPAEDLELEYLKRRYTAEFETSLRGAFAALSVQDRNVMRYYVAEGLTIDGIGAIYGVHRSTAARWVKRITDTLMNEARQKLMSRLRADRAEVSSILRLIQSRLEGALTSVIVR